MHYLSWRRQALSCAVVLVGAGSTGAWGATEGTDASTAPAHTVSGNVALVSDYRFRGISQTFMGPAIQGGFDYAHASGIYAGTWGSNLSGLQYPNGSGLEWDLYAGYKQALSDAISIDVGVLQYYYPGIFYVAGDGSEVKADTSEVYVGASIQFVSIKYFYSLSDWFGVNEKTYVDCGIRYDTQRCHGVQDSGSEGSDYLDVSASKEWAGGWVTAAHVGHQRVAGFEHYDYTDYKLSINRVVNGVNLGVAFVDTDANAGFYNVTDANNKNEVLSDSGVVLSVARSL